MSLAFLRDWNSYSSHRNGDREYLIETGEGNLPYLKITQSVCKDGLTGFPQAIGAALQGDQIKDGIPDG